MQSAPALSTGDAGTGTGVVCIHSECQQLGAVARVDGPARTEVSCDVRRFLRQPARARPWPAGCVVSVWPDEDRASSSPSFCRRPGGTVRFGRPLVWRRRRAGRRAGPPAPRTVPLPCTNRHCSRCSMPRRRRPTMPTASATPCGEAGALGLDAGHRDAGRRALHRLLDGRRRLAANARAAQTGHRPVGGQRAGVGTRLVQRTDTAGGPSATLRHSGALPGGPPLDSPRTHRVAWPGCWPACCRASSSSSWRASGTWARSPTLRW